MEQPPPSDGPLVEKRKRFLERHRERLSDQAPAHDADSMGSGPRNRHDRPQVPVGQRVVPNWPVLDLGVHPEVAPEDWRLEVCGLVEEPFELDYEGLLAMPQVEIHADFHCVTTWSMLDSGWRGVRFFDLAARAMPTTEARFVLCTGYDADPGSGEPYTTNLTLADALQPEVEDPDRDVLLVHTWNGEPLPREHGGPVRIITPRLYAWKGAKWIRRIEFLAEDRLGFWERRGYSNTARPWANDRYSR
jgi:DMSO/TMAO reductase YedYZ molybdopterin-dependent catalytic subunit